MRVVVLGAGILGSSTALHLARAGHAVTLVDGRGAAGGTSGLGAGILSLGLPDAMNRALVLRSMWGLASLAPEPVRLRRPGSHHVAGAEGVEVLRRIHAGLEAVGVPSAMWSPGDWIERLAVRGLDAEAGGVARVLSIDHDAFADTATSTRLVGAAAADVGVRFAGSAARAMNRSAGGAFESVGLGDGTRISADAAVVALGAWSRAFLASQGLRLPTLGYRTHASTWRCEGAGRFPILHDTPHGYYGRQVDEGTILLGNGTRLVPTEPEGFDTNPEPGFAQDVLGKARRRFPALDARPVRAWRGVLTGVPDRRPLVGPHPDADGVFLATGGNGFGFMRGYALGELAAARVAGESAPAGFPSGIDAWADPARFWPDPPTDFPLREGFVLEP